MSQPSTPHSVFFGVAPPRINHSAPPFPPPPPPPSPSHWSFSFSLLWCGVFLFIFCVLQFLSLLDLLSYSCALFLLVCSFILCLYMVYHSFILYILINICFLPAQHYICLNPLTPHPSTQLLIVFEILRWRVRSGRRMGWKMGSFAHLPTVAGGWERWGWARIVG